jgi:hypothetical protein
MFQSPSFSFWNIVFTAIGVSVFWGKWGRSKLQAYLLHDVVNLLHLSEERRGAIEFLIFLVLGCLVGIGVTQPTTPAQAITAGFGWTGLFAHHALKR